MRALKQTHDLSPYQLAVIDHLQNKKNLIVEARAGSGKTSTIVEAIKTLPATAKILCVAFNKKIAEELKRRLPSHVHTSTINGLGHVMLRKYWGGEAMLNMRKLEDTISDHLKKDIHRNVITQLVRGAITYGYFPERYQEPFGIKFNQIPMETSEETQDHQELVDQILCAYVENNTSFDFDEQIYAPIALGIQAHQQYDYLFVDEAQDLSFLKMKLTFKFLSGNGKYVAIGDSMQAIYEFAGAQQDSMQMIQQEMGCEVLKLPVSYRCPRQVVKEAQAFVKDIEPAPNAFEGLVSEMSMNVFLEQDFGPSTLILCRNNGPLFNLAFRMFSQNQPFRFERFDQMKEKILDFLAAPELKTIPEVVDFYDDKLIELNQLILEEKDSKKKSRLRYKLNEMSEHLDMLKNLAVDTGFNQVLDLQARIMNLSVNKTGPLLSTVHKAKGLEAEDVFILQRELFKLSEQQERNLLYVAITRALRNLFYI